MKKIVEFLKLVGGALFCNWDSPRPSYGKLAFPFVLFYCLRNFKDFNEYWLGLLIAILGYIYSSGISAPGGMIERVKEIAANATNKPDEGSNK